MSKYIAVIHRRGTAHDAKRLLDVPNADGLVHVTVDVIEEGGIHNYSSKADATPLPLAMMSLWFGPDTMPALDELLPDDAYVYAVDEHVQWDHLPPRKPGEKTQAVKRVGFGRRLPTVTHEHFAQHWRDVHGPLSRVHHPTIVAYRQNIVEKVMSDGTPDVDGIVEHWYATREALVDRHFASEQSRAIITADLETFTDLTAGVTFVASEHIVW